MNKFLRWAIAFWAVAAFAFAAHAPVSAQTSTASKPDYSKEPYVVQSATSKLVFQNDGKFTEESSIRILIQSNAGLQAYGILHFPYASAMATTEITYIRVTKPDGTVIETPASDVMEVTPDISREAPTYSDLKDKQVAVKGLQVGDTLEYASRGEVNNPLIPGQFWFSNNFIRGAVVLQEELQISVPRGRYVQVKNRDVQPAISDQGDARIYDWKSASLQPTADNDNKDASAADPDEIADVQLTTFHSWDEVGQWFKSLVDAQAAVTPAIQAKANAFTSSAKSDSDKIHALYDFVSLKYRYVGISLGIGRYQPHAAADVLSNDFGDCKDKDTLFTALLAAENIKAVPVLINSSGKIDPDVPSPGQFDHVITALPQDKGYLFLDTTPEVAPYGFLMATLRDNQALLMPAQGPATLVQTPADPPFPQFAFYSAAATLDDAGTLDSLEQMILRGDDEVALRALLRQAGPAKWNDTVQEVVSNLGFGGTVSEVWATSTEATEHPVRITYNYNRKEFSDWKDGQISPPIPPFILAAAPDDDKNAKPIKLGSPDDMFYQATVKLPTGSKPLLPATVDLHESFADYHAEYFIVDGEVHAHRRLKTRVNEIPVEQIDAYRAFSKAIIQDENTYISLQGGSGASNVPSAARPTPRDLQIKPEVRDLLQQAQAAAKRGDMAAAVDASQKAANADPQFAASWLVLGTDQINMHQEGDGIASIKKAIALDASDPSQYETVASELESRRRLEPALEIFEALAAARPQDTSPPTQIGFILNAQQHYSDAAKVLEAVVQKAPTDESTLQALGNAYLHLPGEEDKQKGAEFLVRAGDLAITFSGLNDVAWELADNHLKLDDALLFAQEAVQRVEAMSATTSMESLDIDDVRTTGSMADLWDTLGWADYLLGRFDEAEKYLNAAWDLSQSATMGSHLGLVYEKEGKKHEAALAYAGALSVKGPVPVGTKELLEELEKDEKGKVKPDPAMLEQMRTMSLPWRQVDTNASADFFVMLAPGPRVVGVKFISGSEDLRDAAKVLAAAQFDVPFPDKGPVQILRRGRLSCGPQVSATHCVFVMYPPGAVNSVN